MKEANGIVKKRLVFVTIIFFLLIVTSFISSFSTLANESNSSADFQHSLTITTYAYSFSEGKCVPTRSSMLIVYRRNTIIPDRQIIVFCGTTETITPVYPGETYKIIAIKFPYLIGTQNYKIPEQQTTQILTEHPTRVDMNTFFGAMPEI